MDTEYFNLLKVSLDVAKNRLETIKKRHKIELKAASDNVDIATKKLEDYVRDTFITDIDAFLGDAPVVIATEDAVSSIDELLARKKLGCSIYGTVMDKSNVYQSEKYICIHVKSPKWIRVLSEKSCPELFDESFCRQGFSNNELANNQYLPCRDFEDIRRIYERKITEYLEYIDSVTNEFLKRCEGAKLYLGEDGDGGCEWYWLHAIHNKNSCCIALDYDGEDDWTISNIAPYKNRKPKPEAYGGHGIVVKESTLLRYKRMLTAVKLHAKRKYAKELDAARKYFDACVEAKKCEK